MLTAEQIVRGIVDAHISSNEETLFGNWLERLAIYSNSLVFRGRKSANPGIDLEFEREGIIYYVAIKSGPNWENSSQMINKFTREFAIGFCKEDGGVDRAKPVAFNSGISGIG